MSIFKGSEAIKKPLSESALNKKSLCDYVINVATGCTFGCTFCLVPINRRGTNLERMRAAGLEWVDILQDRKAWAEYFLQQWYELEQLRRRLRLGDRLHIWTDAGLQSFIDQKAIEHWWYRPTPEVWS